MLAGQGSQGFVGGGCRARATFQDEGADPVRAAVDDCDGAGISTAVSEADSCSGKGEEGHDVQHVEEYRGVGPAYLVHAVVPRVFISFVFFIISNRIINC